MHRRAPKIVHENVRYRRMRSQIAIFTNRANIVEHEIAITAIVITQNASGGHYSAQNTTRKRSRRRGHRCFRFPKHGSGGFYGVFHVLFVSQLIIAFFKAKGHIRRVETTPPVII